ncbi:MAG: molybdopterin-dependent oxidoreductase, partial [Oligoflexia bacterium]|nr:molybdopterin-dependent oxidoreductase [Oligoflexia bacterium]
MKSLTRREFIRIAGAGLGASLVPFSLSRLVAAGAGAAPGQPWDSERTPTYCEMCFWKCAGWVHKDENGAPWKIIGNDVDQHSYGRMCTRGTGGIGAYLDGDRLKRPLIRVEERGRQVFKEVSWDEALSYTADKLKKIAREHGPERVALFSHGTGGDLMKIMLKAYGSANITAPSYAQCRGPISEAFVLTYGEELGNPERLDIRNTRCLVLIGSHLGENLHNSQVQEFAEVVGRGDTIITVDPRFSTAASKSKFWLPIKPSTDIALLLAWIHVLITEDLYDKQYIAANTVGFNELKQHVATLTPEWAYPITGIRPEVIRETAREMAKNAPATIVHPSRHAVWYGDDTQRIRAIAILNGLLGNWGRKGGLYLPNKPKVPPYPAREAKGKATWRQLLGDRFPLASLAPANVIRDFTIAHQGGEGYFKGWLVYGSNLNQCLPDPARTIEAIQKLDLLMVVDTMPAEITGWADVVLPECSYLERYDDLRVSEGREAQIALRAPAFEPKDDTKPGWWIVRQLAAKLGLDEYFPWTDFEQYLDVRLRKVGSSLEEM